MGDHDDIHQLLTMRFKEILHRHEGKQHDPPVLRGGGTEPFHPGALVALIVVALAVAGVVQLKTGLFAPPHRRRVRPLASQLVLIFSCLLYMAPLLCQYHMVSWLAALVGAVSLVYHSTQVMGGSSTKQAFAYTSVAVAVCVAATVVVTQRLPIWWALLWLLPVGLYVVANLPANKEMPRYGYLQAGVHLLSAGLLTVFAMKK